jgi:hypothetical protein
MELYKNKHIVNETTDFRTNKQYKRTTYKETTDTTKKEETANKTSTKTFLWGKKYSRRLKFICRLRCHRYLYRREMCRILPNWVIGATDARLTNSPQRGNNTDHYSALISRTPVLSFQRPAVFSRLLDNAVARGRLSSLSHKVVVFGRTSVDPHSYTQIVIKNNCNIHMMEVRM